MHLIRKDERHLFRFKKSRTLPRRASTFEYSSISFTGSAMFLSLQV